MPRRPVSFQGGLQIVLEAQLGLSDSTARLPSSGSPYRGTFGSRLSSILHNVFSPSGRYFLPEVVITGYASSRKNLCARNLALPFFSSVYRGRLCASGLAVSHLCCRLSINAWVIHNLTPLGIHVSDIHDHRGPASKRQRQMGGGGGGRKKEKRKGNVMSNVYHCGCRASLVLAFEMLENCRSKWIRSFLYYLFRGFASFQWLEKNYVTLIVVQHKMQCKVYHTLIRIEGKLPKS